MGSFAMVTTSTYLDHASATPLDERARAALLAALDEFADPLRVHGDGFGAPRLLRHSRPDRPAGAPAAPRPAPRARRRLGRSALARRLSRDRRGRPPGATRRDRFHERRDRIGGTRDL